MNGGGAETEGETECEAGSRLWAVSTEPDMGLKLTDCEIMTWAEVKHSTDWATQEPWGMLTFEKTIYYVRNSFTLRLLYWRKLKMPCGKAMWRHRGTCPATRSSNHPINFLDMWVQSHLGCCLCIFFILNIFPKCLWSLVAYSYLKDKLKTN